MSKHKRHKEWWDDEEDYYAGRYGNIFDDRQVVNQELGFVQPTTTTKGYGWAKSGGYDYKNYFYKKSFDFSVSLETRVKQLIQTISGKELKLAEANGWGSDDKYFYYNPNDLENATDDEVLGLIFHQLARELFYPKKEMKAIQKVEPQYRHLLETLEDSRADKLMQDKYFGANYYLTNVWLSVKKESSRPRVGIYGEPIIPAQEFCYNITAEGNNDVEFSGNDKKAMTGFLKARPAVIKYLACKNFEDCLPFYTEIKKYYPVPDEQQQRQMDSQMLGTSILSDKMRAEAKRQAQAEERRQQGEDMDKGYDLSESEKQETREYSRYTKAMAEQAGVINALHKLLASVLKDNDTKRFIGRMKRGKIDGKALHKMIMLGSDRVFKKEREPAHKKYAMTILVDQSGSMSGERIDNAFAGAVILAEVFQKLDIAFQVVGFDTKFRVYKNFFAMPKREVLGGVYSAIGGGTDDHFAIKKVGESFDRIPDTYQKALFVLTDGDGRGEDVKSLIVDLQNKHRIKTYGVGLGCVSEYSFQRTYPKFVLTPETSDLPNALVNLVREQFKRE